MTARAISTKASDRKQADKALKDTPSARVLAAQQRKTERVSAQPIGRKDK